MLLLTAPLPAMSYPRLANLYTFSNPQQIAAFRRYGLVVASTPACSVATMTALKAAAPSATVVFSYTANSVWISDFNGLTISPGWWLTLVGTTLSASLDAVSTTVSVVNASIINARLGTNPHIIVDTESMVVNSVNTGANTLSVTRGYRSAAAPHGSGARCAAHATDWPGKWELNCSSYCPADPISGLTWTAYLATQVQAAMAAGWDGVFYDSANLSTAFISSGQVDADQNNVADGGDGASGTGWADGMTALLSNTRSLIPSAVLLTNGTYFAGASSGEELESFQSWSWGWENNLCISLALAGPNVVSPTVSAPYSIVNPDTANSGTQNLQTMRFNLALALLGNGYYIYDYGTTGHGATWWYDEYDNGAGSSLISAMTNSQTTATLVTGSGGTFVVGDVIQVPGDSLVFDDEQMHITGIAGDVLTVTRGFNGSTAVSHPILSKVMTAAQISAGQGWLGQPLAPAYSVASVGANTVTNGSFEGTSSTYFNNWSVGNFGPATGTTVQDTSTFSAGASSVKTVITKADPGNGWAYQLVSSGSLGVVAGSVYTLSFWAKGSAFESVTANIGLSVSPFTGLLSKLFPLTEQWQRYSMVFAAASTVGVRVLFDMANALGTIWLDDVQFVAGDVHLWRRDFERGTVLLNGTAGVQTVAVGSGYRHIAGTQDQTINTGAVVSSVTIPVQDGVLLAVVEEVPPVGLTYSHIEALVSNPALLGQIAVSLYGQAGSRIGEATAAELALCEAIIRDPTPYAARCVVGVLLTLAGTLTSTTPGTLDTPPTDSAVDAAIDACWDAQVLVGV